MKRFLPIVLLLLCVPLLTGCGRNTLYTQKKFLLGTVIKVSFYNKGNRAGRWESERIFNKIFDRLQTLDSKLNPLNPVSELSSMNGNASLSYVKVSKDVFGLLQKAKKSMEITEGAFSITLSPVFELIRSNGQPSTYVLGQVLERTKPSVLELDSTLSQVRFGMDGVNVNLSRIQRGYVVDLIAEVLKDYRIRSAYIEAGNTAYAFGSRRAWFGKTWKYPLTESNENTTRVIGKVKLKNKAAAIFMASEDYYENLAVWRGIVAPKVATSNTPAGAVVVAPNALTAQVLADTLMVLGYEQGSIFMKQFPYEYAILYKDENGKKKVLGTHNLRRAIRW